VLAQESLQVLVGDPQDAVEPVRNQLPRLDPAPNRPGGDPQTFGDVGNGEKTHVDFAIAPRANGSVSEVGRFDHFATSHAGDPEWLRTAIATTPAGCVIPLAGPVEHALERRHRDLDQAADSQSRNLSGMYGLVRR
jgi:hypothetical protein